MRKALLIALLVAGPVAAGAQTQKGDHLVGVSVGSASYTDSDSKTTYSNTPTQYNSDGSSFSVSVYPTYGWFVMDDLAVGAGASLSFYSSKATSSNTGSTTTTDSTSTQPSVYLGPFAKYYFGGNERGKAFVQANLQYGLYFGSTKSSTSTGASAKTTTKPGYDWNAGAAVGYEYFLSPWVGLYGSVGLNYGASKTKYEYRPSAATGYDYTSSYSRLYFPVNVGFQIHVPSSWK